MKKIILPWLVFLVLGMSAETKPLERCAKKSEAPIELTNFYAQIFSGANLLQSSTVTHNEAHYHTGYVVAGSLGYCWRYGLHFEGEYAFRKNGIRNIHFFNAEWAHTGNFFTSSYMANFLWYMPLSSWGCKCWNVRPVVGTGLGYDFQQMHASNSRYAFYQRWRNFAWQLIAGFAFPIFRNAELAVEYKFHQGSSHFYNHAFGLGFTYKFGFF